jgi:two-component system response regulator FixJ
MGTEPLVYLIDDDEGARGSLSFVLKSAGLSVRVHESAIDFLRITDDLEPGCIITDVRMPGMNGLELVTRLKERGVTHPVIMITGHADVPMAIQALHAGVSDFIEKPFTGEAILGAVQAALTKQQSRSEISSERDEIVKRLATLSGREREVMQGLVDGKVNKVIGHELDISARTVEVYRANVMNKMSAGTLSELVRMVMIARLA